MVLEEKIKDIVEDAIEKQFDKILVVDFNGRKINIAPLKSQMPKIHELKIKDDDLYIVFQGNLSDIIKSTSGVDIIKNENGEIKGAIISSLSKINKSEHRIKINNMLTHDISHMPQNNDKKQIITNHLQSRIIYAIKDMIKLIYNDESQLLQS